MTRKTTADAKVGQLEWKPGPLGRIKRISDGAIVILIYVFFLVGALWKSSGVLPDVMKPTVPFVLVGATLLMVWWTYEFSLKLLAVFGVIFIVTWAVDALGVATTFPFGTIAYTDALGWRVLEVPVVKPFIWLLIIAVSDAAVGHFFGRLSCVLTAIFATILDFFLEVSAKALDLWQWSTAFPPLSNYAGWFVVCLAAVLLLRDHASRKVQLRLPAHAYIALMLFFAITFLGVKSGLLRLY